jgi:hypothetical protein
MDELLDGARTIARVNAWKAYDKATKEHESARVAFQKLMAPCPGYCPPGYQGHWRDWHKGHGCEADIRGNLLEYEREIAATPETKPAPQKVEPEVLDGFGAPILAGETYLISDDRSRDNVIWWNPKSAGYTGSVDRAGRYTGEEAARICYRSRNETPTNLFDNPVAWPEGRITGDLISRIVDCGVLLDAARAGKGADRG